MNPQELRFEEIREHIRKVYLAYERPFIIGYSGGKDSTATLQLVWEALIKLPKAERIHPIHAICTDTLVETPYIVQFIDRNLEAIGSAAVKAGLPLTSHKLIPDIRQSFWVNLIGRGYPAPSRMFRWCTERLKIEPVDRFISTEVSQFGQATVVLGARKSESASRSQVLAKKKRDALGLSKHTSLSAAYVYTPIEELTTDDVWNYLLTHPCPWGLDNRDLLAMYQSASSGECPIVLDKSTPSCGNSRFGCWVCTLVERDTTMENLIDQGEEWMQPLLDFRDLLHETQDPAKKEIYRSHKKRSGQVQFVHDTDRISRGPYKFEWRMKFLRQLLDIQKHIREDKDKSGFVVIRHDELEEIRRIWREEEQDWRDSVPLINQDVMGDSGDWRAEDGIQFSDEDRELLQELSRAEGIPAELVAKLIDEERKVQGMRRRAGILMSIDRVLGEDWRSEDEVVRTVEVKHDHQ